ncbi:MAG: HRDC domain-containing protein, partial [Verrucomicrobiota bacterium]|nr:HRDC domain-containing protein [Verrucomicrobiota bacterium]
YFEKLCLIQISTADLHVLVDPLAGISLQPLFEALADKDLVFHGADYDLRLLRRSAGFEPVRIFDTMIAARLVGDPEFSLAALVRKYFGVELVKASQKANWAQRPLSEKMAEYAMNDSRYVLELSDILRKRLLELGRWEWFAQSCEKAVASARTTRERDLENAWRIRGSSELTGIATALLRALWNWREEEAKAVDRPPFHILQNEQLVGAAAALARGELPQFHRMNLSRWNRFKVAADTALRLPESQWPKPIPRLRLRQTPEQERRFFQLKKIRDSAATELVLDPSMIAPKAVLESLANDEDGAADKLMPWQLGLLGLTDVDRRNFLPGPEFNSAKL